MSYGRQIAAFLMPVTNCTPARAYLAPYRHTLYFGGLGPGSKNWKFSPTPWPNWNLLAVPSSSQRVLQLWSNRTWSTWLLFLPRKWPSEASKHHFFPLRGLGEGCALWGARKSSLTWEAARPKRRFLRKTDSNSDFHCLRRPCWMACDPSTLSEEQGYGLRTPRRRTTKAMARRRTTSRPGPL